MASSSDRPCELKIVFSSALSFVTCAVSRSLTATPLRATNVVGRFDQPLSFFEELNANCMLDCWEALSEALNALAAETAFAVNEAAAAGFATASLVPVDALPAAAGLAEPNSDRPAAATTTTTKSGKIERRSKVNTLPSGNDRETASAVCPAGVS